MTKPTQFIVTVQMQTGPAATVVVLATNRADAEYRACYKVETERGGLTSHVSACRPYR